MADKKIRYSQNIAGNYYVDEQCIACDACVVEAPDFFAMNDEKGHAFVKKQPLKAVDITLCESALSICPVSAIGNDGDKTGGTSS
ncbi:MAG: ferredoxin [Bacteriovoracaceae bacterium]|nr:ferredoxin [Bacteriovoracaceae bacterium]